MKILALDPGSKVTGYALLKGLEPGDLLGCGLLKGSAAVGLAMDNSDCVNAWWLAGKDCAAWRRIQSIGKDLVELLKETRPEVCAIEIASGKIGTGANRGARGSLTTYGMAVGYLARCAEQNVRTIPVNERDWTRHTGPKSSRTKIIALIYPAQKWNSCDPGGDARDAIGLGRWVLRQWEERKR